MSPVRFSQTRLQAIKPQQCPCCHQMFDSAEDKVDHQNKFGHFKCISCERRFPDGSSVVKHQLQDHKAVPKITCPGCEVMYDSASDWFQHIEVNICSGTFKSDVELHRQQLEAFRAALGDRFATNDFHLSYTPTDTWAEETPGPAYDNFQVHGGTVVEQQYNKQEDFPRLPTNQYRAGDNQGLDLLSGDAFNPAKKQMSAWAKSKPGQQQPAQKKTYNAVLAPMAYSPPQMTQVAGPAGIVTPTGVCKDPYDPRFDPTVFMCSILGKYKCPHFTCGVETNTAIGMTKHLKSPVHQEKREMCPSCKRTFPGKTALIRHVETAYARCFMPNKGNFTEVLSNLNEAMLDMKLNIKDENGQDRKISVDELRDDQTQSFATTLIATTVGGNRGGNTDHGGVGSWEGSQLQGKESNFW